MFSNENRSFWTRNRKFHFLAFWPKRYMEGTIVDWYINLSSRLNIQDHFSKKKNIFQKVGKHISFPNYYWKSNLTLPKNFNNLLSILNLRIAWKCQNHPKISFAIKTFQLYFRIFCQFLINYISRELLKYKTHFKFNRSPIILMNQLLIFIFCVFS